MPLESKHLGRYCCLAHYSWLMMMYASFIIWAGCNWIHRKIRILYAPLSNPFSKLAMVSFVSALYGACIGCLASLTWFQLSKEIFSWETLARFTILCVLAVLVFTLIYEILFLSKEKKTTYFYTCKRQFLLIF